MQSRQRCRQKDEYSDQPYSHLCIHLIAPFRVCCSFPIYVLRHLPWLVYFSPYDLRSGAQIVLLTSTLAKDRVLRQSPAANLQVKVNLKVCRDSFERAPAMLCLRRGEKTTNKSRVRLGLEHCQDAPPAPSTYPRPLPPVARLPHR